MSRKFHAIVKPTHLDNFNDEMNPLRIMLQDHFAPISDQPDEEAVQAIINTSILRDYGESLTEGLRRHLHETCGFLLTSIKFEGFHVTKDQNNEDNYCLEVSLNKGDIHLLDFYILDEDLEQAINSDVVNDSIGLYENCPREVSKWRITHPERRTPNDRGLLVNIAASKDWSYDLDFKSLKEKISDLKPSLNTKKDRTLNFKPRAHEPLAGV